MTPQLLVGIDVGSTTVKAVAVDAVTDAIVWSDYQRHETKQPEKTLEIGTMIAKNRGKIRYPKGSIASARSPSICSVTAIVPSSAVLLAPTRPEIMSAVRTGPTSRKMPNPAPQPSS